MVFQANIFNSKKEYLYLTWKTLIQIQKKQSFLYSDQKTDSTRMIKILISLINMMITYLHVPKIRAPNFIKQILSTSREI